MSTPPQIAERLLLAQLASTLFISALMGVCFYLSLALGYSLILPVSFSLMFELHHSLIGLTSIVIAMLIIGRLFSFPFTILIAYLSLWLKNKVSLWILVVTTPISGFLLWYGYDRFVPDYGFMNDPAPFYYHGLTWARFGIAWLTETSIVIAYWYPLRKLRLANATNEQK